MHTPTKHENLNLNILVLGADLLSCLRGETHNVESLFHSVRNKKELTIDVYFDAFLFLWLAGYVELDEKAQIRRLK